MNMQFEINVLSNKHDVMQALGDNIEKALEECGMAARRYAKQKITQELKMSPEGWYKRTGALRNNINYAVDTKAGTMTVGSPQEYAPYFELGTGIYTPGGRRTPWGYIGNDGEVHFTHGMPPRPFIKPAIEDHISKYRQIILANLKDNGGIV